MAEESFIGLLIASERVAGWVQTFRDYKRGSASLARVKHALKEMVEAIQSESYAEEARRAGAVPMLTGLLKVTEDEDLLQLTSDALAACSGLMATSRKVRTFHYEDTPVVLQEGALGDGVGAKVWTVAHFLCRQMAAHPGIVRGHRVLEIGAGCGACGILAAKLGAQQVVLTDYVDAVLQNLRDCVHLNAPSGAQQGAAQDGESSAAGGAPATTAAAANGGPDSAPTSSRAETAAEEAARRREELAEAEAWDPEDASECSSEGDFDAFLGEAQGCASGGASAGQHGAEQQAAAREQKPWDAPPMRVRFYDWQDSFDWLAPAEREALVGVQGVPRSTKAAPGDSIDTASNHSGVPGMGLEEQFDVVLGTDILYEWPMVLLVPSVLKHRLRPGGRALVCCAVREQVMHDAAVRAMEALGLRVQQQPIIPDPVDVLDIRQDYEGGYVMLAIEHADAPANDWHSPDLFA